MAEQDAQVERGPESKAPADDGPLTEVEERQGKRHDEQEGQGGEQYIGAEQAAGRQIGLNQRDQDEGESEQALGRKVRASDEPIHLEPCQCAHHGDAGEPRDAAKVEDKDDDRTPDQGGENAGTQHVGAPVWDGRRACYLFGTLPKRRSRWLYSVSAAAISASSKSGQKVGVA